MTKVCRIILIFVLPLLLLAVTVNGKSRKRAGSSETKNIVWPLPPDEPRIKYLYSFSTPSDLSIREGKMRKFWSKVRGSNVQKKVIRPFGVVFDNELDLTVVTDTVLGGIHIFDKKRKKYSFVRNVGDYRLESPIDAVIVNEKIYVTDSTKAAVFVFDLKGKYISSFGEDILKRPTGIAYDPSANQLAVVDTIGNSIRIFSLNGVLVGMVGNRGKSDEQFNFPTGIDIDDSGYKYITDSLNFKVKIFDNNWDFVSSFGEAGDVMGMFSKPKGIAVDSEGHIFVVDSLFDVVQIFDKEGNFLLNFGNPGHSPGEFSLPSGIHIDSRDRIFVSDSFNGRIEVFQYLAGDKLEE